MEIDAKGRSEAVERAYVLRDLIAAEVDARDIEKAVRMSARALNYLKSHSVHELGEVLALPYPAQMGAVHWEVFRDVVSPELREIAARYPDPTTQKLHTLYTLGWLARLARVRGIGPATGFARDRQPERAQRERPPRDRPTLTIPDAPASTIADLIGPAALSTVLSRGGVGGQIAGGVPKARPAIAYSRGQKVQGRVIERHPQTGIGKVELEDGTIVAKVNVFACEVGEEYRFTVTDISTKGTVASLKK